MFKGDADRMPMVTTGIVVTQDADNGLLYVALRTTGQVLPVIMSYPGGADGVRIRQLPMPGRGCWGIILFPYGDPRNGIWLCSYLPTLMDALTGTVSGTGVTTSGDPFIDYHSHFSGFWSMLTGSGEHSVQWSDGSWAQAASGTDLATVYRHVVEQGQDRQKKEFPWEDRVPDPPSPFNYVFNHKSGTSATVSSGGSVSVSGASGAELDLSFGGTDIHVDASGNTSITGAGGATLNITFGENSITMDPSGITINAAAMINVNAAGDVNVQGGGLVTVTAAGLLSLLGAPITLN